MLKKVLIYSLFSISVLSIHAQNTAEEYIKTYNQRIKMERINDVYIPRDLYDAMKELDRLTEVKVAAKLKSSPEDTIASKLHFSLGRWMLLNWGLEEGSRLSYYLKSKGLSFPDDMMDLLIRCWYRHIKKLPMEENKLIQKYIIKRKEGYLKSLRSIETIHIDKKLR